MKIKKLMVPILIVVVGIVLGTGGTLAAQKLFFKSSAPAQAAPKPDGPLVSIGDFTVNLQGGSYLKTTITLEGTNAKSAAIITGKEAFLQDRVNTVLSGKSLADVETQAGRLKLRQELLAQLNQVADNNIQDVLFVSFVYQ